MKKAMCGNDYIRNSNWIPITKDLNGWSGWAKKEARRMAKVDNVAWAGVVAYIPWRGCYRVSFGYQSYNVLTGQ